LEVQSTEWTFAPIRIDINARSGQIKAFKFGYELSPISYPLRLEPEFLNSYFMVREGFSIGSLIRNPMMIMLGVTLLMTVLVPKMMSNLDPEALQELQGGKDKEAKEPPVKWVAPTLALKNT